MRTFAEIYSDIGRAVSISDFNAVDALATEMSLLGTREADAAAANARAVVLSHSGRYHESLEVYRKALDLYEALNDRDGISRVIGGMAIVYTELGDIEESLKYYHRALAIHIEEDDPTNIAVVTGNIGTIHLTNGQYPEALEHFRRSLDLYIACDEPNGQATSLDNVGLVYLYTGDYPQAMDYFHRARAIHEMQNDRHGVASATANIGRVYHLTGDHSKALEQYDSAMKLYEREQDPSSTAQITASIGAIYHARKDTLQALQCYRQALATHEALGRRIDVQRTVGNVIAALLECGEIDEARDLLNSQVMSSMDTPRVLAEHHANRASLGELTDDLHGAREHLLQALAIVSEKGIRSLEAQYHLRLRDLAQRLNDFPNYILHNNKHTEITEEIRGKDVTQKLAVMEAERKIEAELRERDKERALLYGALPQSVAQRLIRGEQLTGDHFEHAAVLFLDVSEFTSHSADLHPARVVVLLEDIFRTLDDFCEKHGVTKIKTIGDSYMCFRGDGAPSENASSIASVALTAFSATFTWPNGEPVRFRAGAHIGPATAGVIGTQRLQYDVWGDTVNVASRMESSGEPGRIHVSEAFANALKSVDGGQWTADVTNDSMTTDSMTLFKRGTIEVKGKGPMTTYWLEGA